MMGGVLGGGGGGIFTREASMSAICLGFLAGWPWPSPGHDFVIVLSWLCNCCPGFVMVLSWFCIFFMFCLCQCFLSTSLG